MCRVDEKSVIFVTIFFLVKDVENAFSLVICKKIVVSWFLYDNDSNYVFHFIKRLLVWVWMFDRDWDGELLVWTFFIRVMASSN